MAETALAVIGVVSRTQLEMTVLKRVMSSGSPCLEENFLKVGMSCCVMLVG